MQENDLIVIFLGIMATAIVGIVFKIIWDWLKHGRSQLPFNAGCPECSRLGSRIHELEACMIQEKMTRKTIEAEITAHEKRLNEGSEVMKKLKEDISDIKTNVATLLERSKRTREDYERA